MHRALHHRPGLGRDRTALGGSGCFGALSSIHRYQTSPSRSLIPAAITKATIQAVVRTPKQPDAKLAPPPLTAALHPPTVRNATSTATWFRGRTARARSYSLARAVPAADGPAHSSRRIQSTMTAGRHAVAPNSNPARACLPMTTPPRKSNSYIGQFAAATPVEAGVRSVRI